MNTLKTQTIKLPLNYFRLIYNFQRLQMCVSNFKISTYHGSTVDVISAITNDFFQRHRIILKINTLANFSIQYYTDINRHHSVSSTSQEELDAKLLDLMAKKRDKQIECIVLECLHIRRFINESILKKLFKNYSITGKPEMIIVLQKYCAKVDPNLYKRNGEFLHYLAKAQCMKGNAECGLSILKTCYIKYEKLRSFYRLILRELIQDSVLNRSEASLVIFKKYVLEFSKQWNDHYPLVCFWHMCWSSTWFSDQMLSDELLETSEMLRDIIKERATTLSITILRDDYNEDAVLSLLQTLLKYNMMEEYAKVLQVLFNFKLKNRDIRGCAEIIRNCEVLGVTLPSNQQGRYIKMLIEGNKTDAEPSAKPTTTSIDFKLKF